MQKVEETVQKFEEAIVKAEEKKSEKEEERNLKERVTIVQQEVKQEVSSCIVKTAHQTVTHWI